MTMLAPADRDTVIRSLTELTLTCAFREQDGDSEKLRVALYADRLNEYPSDAVSAVCREWADENVFFPTWAELRERLEERVKYRRMMLEALR